MYFGCFLPAKRQPEAATRSGNQKRQPEAAKCSEDGAGSGEREARSEKREAGSRKRVAAKAQINEVKEFFGRKPGEKIPNAKILTGLTD